MPLLGFTKLLDKLLDGSKTQTIRVPRKRSLYVGEKLYIYWRLRTKNCFKLGEGIITDIYTMRVCEITEEIWIKDGFEDGTLGYGCFMEMHKDLQPTDFVNIITWKWTS